MPDIASKLFPNILTIFTQLCATGVIYLLYRRFLHEPVMAYLDRQAKELNKAQHYADEVEKEAKVKAERLEAEHQQQIEALRRSQETMKKETEKEREEILKQAEAQGERILQQTEAELEKKKTEMLREVEEHVLEIAVNVTERTLDNYSYDEDDMYHSLETELEQISNETH